VDEFERAVEELFVNGFHPLRVERTGVLNLLLTDFSKLRVHGRVVGGRGPAVKDATRTELLFEFRILGIIGIFRLLLGVEVVKVAKEFIEPVDRGQELIAVAQVILTKLAADVSHWLKQLGDCRILRLDSQRRSWQANFGHASADWRLA